MNQSSSQSFDFFHRWRTFFSFVTYSVTSLIGTVIGLYFYLPKPPSLSENFVINDLRYGGALAGAFLGTVLAAAITPRLAPRVIAGKSYWIGAVPAVALGFLVLKDKALVGGTTLLIWVMPLLLVGLSARNRRAV